MRDRLTMTKSVLCNTGTNLKLVTLLFMVKIEGACPRVWLFIFAVFVSTWG